MPGASAGGRDLGTGLADQPFPLPPNGRIIREPARREAVVSVVLPARTRVEKRPVHPMESGVRLRQLHGMNGPGQGWE